MSDAWQRATWQRPLYRKRNPRRKCPTDRTKRETGRA